MIHRQSFLPRLIFSAFTIASVVLINIPPVSAAGASLLLSPSKGSYAVGATFSVSVMVNSGGGQGINAAEASISFSKDVIAINSINQTGSIFELWTTKPTFSNKNGSINFGGGLTDAYKGTAGKLFTVSFSALKEGEAKLTFANSVVAARDGVGTNIFSGANVGSYTVTAKKAVEPTPQPIGRQTTTTQIQLPLPTTGTGNTTNIVETGSGFLPPMVDVLSSTHPDENTWYSTSTAILDWKLPKGIIGISTVMTENSSSTPGSVSDGLLSTKTFDKLAEGRHYFHIKLQNSVGWGKIKHRQILVDTVPPSKPKLELDNGGDSTNPNVAINISSDDKTSGLNLYKIYFNNAEKELTPRNFYADPYILEKLLPGNYAFTVTAYDKAGNLATSSINFIVDSLKAPMITDVPRILTEGEQLIVRGASFYPGAMVSVFVGGVTGDPVKKEVKADANGDWSYFYDGKIKKGEYQVWAKIVDARGAESANSSKQFLSVVTPEIIATYGIYIILALLFIITLLIIYIIMLKKGFAREKGRILDEVGGAQKKVNEIFLALQEEVDELIEYADKKPGLSESEKRIKEKLDEALVISEEFLTKEIEDIEKEVTVPKKKKK
ncbi:MAG: cohesin domain-containing protein [Candidatus Falkowbacteria bacterium]